MAALIAAAGLLYLGIGIYKGDALMVFAGVAMLAIPAVMLFTMLKSKKSTAKIRAGLIERFATEQEEKAKGRQGE